MSAAAHQFAPVRLGPRHDGRSLPDVARAELGVRLGEAALTGELVDAGAGDAEHDGYLMGADDGRRGAILVHVSDCTTRLTSRKPRRRLFLAFRTASVTDKSKGILTWLAT